MTSKIIRESAAAASARTVSEEFMGAGWYILWDYDHAHEVELDEKGDGETDEVTGGNGLSAHQHKVVGGKVMPVNGHSGTLLPAHVSGDEPDTETESATSEGIFKGKAHRMFKSVKRQCMKDGGDAEFCSTKAAKITNAKMSAPSLSTGVRERQTSTPTSRRTVHEWIPALEGFSIEGRTIKGVRLLGPQPKGKPYHYREDAIARAVSLYEGTQVFLDHGEDGENRSVRDLAGRITKPRSSKDGIRGDIVALEDAEGGKLLSVAKDGGLLAGMSHHAEVVMTDDESEITEITRVNSVDLVANPATTRNLFESASGRAGGDDVKTVSELRAAFPALVTEIEEATRKTALSSAETEALKARVEAAEKERDDLRKKASAFESADRVTAAIKKAGNLPEPVVKRIIDRTAGHEVSPEEATKIVTEEAAYFLALTGRRVVEDNGPPDPTTSGGTIAESIRKRMLIAAGLPSEDEKKKGAA